MIGEMNEEYGEPIWLKDAEDDSHIINMNVIYSVGCLEDKNGVHVEYCQLVFEDEAAHIDFSNKLMSFEVGHPDHTEITDLLALPAIKEPHSDL